MTVAPVSKAYFNFIHSIKSEITTTSLLITIFLFVFILLTSTIMTSTNYFGTTTNYFGTITNLAYGQPDQMNSNTTNFVNVQNIPIKKIHV